MYRMFSCGAVAILYTGTHLFIYFFIGFGLQISLCIHRVQYCKEDTASVYGKCLCYNFSVCFS